MHEAMRFFHYSRRTEMAYWGWIVRFLKFHRQSMSDPTPHPGLLVRGEDGRPWRHPRDMGAAEVAQFLSHLAQDQDVAAATQNQALNALVFLYRVVLRQPLGNLGEWARVQRPARLPTVLTSNEVGRLLTAVAPEYQLPVRLIYGSGLRLLDLARLRVKDLSLERRQILVRDGKGQKDRVTMVPEALVQALHEQLTRARLVYDKRKGAYSAALRASTPPFRMEEWDGEVRSFSVISRVSRAIFRLTQTAASSWLPPDPSRAWARW
jgi:hypothetical protein